MKSSHDRPGRPRKPESEKHTVPVKVYLTDQEFTRINQDARRLGMGLSEYLRALALDIVSLARAA